MLDFEVPVIKISKISKHPNADTLSVTEIEGAPVVIRTQDFSEGDIAVYIPVEALIPEGKEWVKKHCSHLKFKRGVHRLKAARLRGIFSMGMVVPYDAVEMALEESGDLNLFWGSAENNISKDVADKLGIIKYEEEEDIVKEPQEKKPKTLWQKIKRFFRRLFGIKIKVSSRVMPVYGVDHYRKLKGVLEPGENVIISEKVHGSNAAFCIHNDKFVVSSHTRVRAVEDDSWYWKVARKYDLANKLFRFPELAFFGEVYGPSVQDMGYGLKNDELKLAFFDIMQLKDRTYLNYDEACAIFDALGLEKVPLIYRGQYIPEVVESLVEGPSLIPGANHPREGFVICPELERINPKCGRIKLKMISEWYLLRKGGTEKH